MARRSRAPRYKAYFANGNVVKIRNENGHSHAWWVDTVGVGYARTRKLAQLAVTAHRRGRELQFEIVPLLLDA